jgi:hypothetical protein
VCARPASSRSSASDGRASNSELSEAADLGVQCRIRRPALVRVIDVCGRDHL